MRKYSEFCSQGVARLLDEAGAFLVGYEDDVRARLCGASRALVEGVAAGDEDSARRDLLQQVILEDARALRATLIGDDHERPHDLAQLAVRLTAARVERMIALGAAPNVVAFPRKENP